MPFVFMRPNFFTDWNHDDDLFVVAECQKISAQYKYIETSPGGTRRSNVGGKFRTKTGLPVKTLEFFAPVPFNRHR